MDFLKSQTVLKRVTLVSLATLLGAFWFEYALGLKPCRLCLQQRYPYYLALVLGLVAILPFWRTSQRRVFCLILAGVFLISALMGAYHAGVEWKFFAGPQDCSGIDAAPASVDSLLQSLQKVRVVNCAEAAWRLFGLSLAGWNVLISLGLAGLSFAGFRYGSSSVSQ